MKKEMDDSRSNSFGVASVILGIQSVVLPLLSPLVLPALVFGIVGLKFSFTQQKISRNKWSKWGKILSIVGIILVILSVIAGAWISQNYPELINQARGFNVAS